jgi:hypothetical protein
MAEPIEGEHRTEQSNWPMRSDFIDQFVESARTEFIDRFLESTRDKMTSAERSRCVREIFGRNVTPIAIRVRDSRRNWTDVT